MPLFLWFPHRKRRLGAPDAGQVARDMDHLGGILGVVSTTAQGRTAAGTLRYDPLGGLLGDKPYMHLRDGLGEQFTVLQRWRQAARRRSQGPINAGKRQDGLSRSELPGIALSRS